ncbi:hypothetical protein Fmac_019707 [Flemingia macrophylla]|uniref:Uncharacterized protein n=1 Tax=Flemingia macrophylla TaxID=520843 RepID=A0ABD1M8J1_9FABA
MAQQDEEAVNANAAIELIRNSENEGSVSFNTLLTASSSSSTNSSSDLDTQQYFLCCSTCVCPLAITKANKIQEVVHAMDGCSCRQFWWVVCGG